MRHRESKASWLAISRVRTTHPIGHRKQQRAIGTSDDLARPAHDWVTGPRIGDDQRVLVVAAHEADIAQSAQCDLGSLLRLPHSIMTRTTTSVWASVVGSLLGLSCSRCLCSR